MKSRSSHPLVAVEMIKLVHESIDADALRTDLVRSEDGAAVIFEGIVRNHARGKRVRHLEYDAYPAMALAKLQEIGARAR